MYLLVQCSHKNNVQKIILQDFGSFHYDFLADCFYFIVIKYGFTFSRVCYKIRNTVAIRIKHLTEKDLGSNMMVKGSHRQA